MKPLTIFAIGLCCFYSAVGAQQGPVNAEHPRLVSSSPKAWEVGVSPQSQHQISITFDQPMHPAYSAWLGRSSIAPLELDFNQKISTDHRTLSIDVKLSPQKVYVLALNETDQDGVGFLNERGHSAAPSYLVFQTAGRPAQQDAPPRVTNTSPVSGAKDLNPAAIRGITLTFDRPMTNKTHGMHLWENKLRVDLKPIGFSYSPDGKVFTLDYSLKPSTRYDVEMNNTEDIGFTATNRVPLWPIRFSFTTGQPH